MIEPVLSFFDVFVHDGMEFLNNASPDSPHRLLPLLFLPVFLALATGLFNFGMCHVFGKFGEFRSGLELPHGLFELLDPDVDHKRLMRRVVVA